LKTHLPAGCPRFDFLPASWVSLPLRSSVYSAPLRYPCSSSSPLPPLPPSLPLPHLFSTPLTPITVSNTLCNPISRPAGSYHSSNECAPPPFPPAPIAIASIPCDNGIFASVLERSIRDSFPTAASAARNAASNAESPANSPPGRLPINSTVHSTLPLLRSRAFSFSSRTPAATHSRSADSNRAISSSDSDRKSTFSFASCGIEFTDVPPSICPKLKLVRGILGTFVLINRTAPRASALIGFTIPKSDQLCPPGPVTVTSSRREASAFVVT